MTGKSEAAAMKDMDAHADLRTLIEAAKIHADKGRHKAAMAKHKEMQAALNAVAAQSANAPGAAQGQPPQGAPAPAPAGPTANGGAY